MMQGNSKLRATIRASRTAAGIAALLVSAALPAWPQRTDPVQRAFEKAVEQRTELESHPEGQRSLDAYKQAIAAYKKVYAIAPPQAEEVTPSLIGVAELYAQMAAQYDPQYFKVAIDSYELLLKEYPHSRFAGPAQFAIAKIQLDDLKEPGEAQATLKDFLERYPKSPMAAEARQDLNQIAQARKVTASAAAPGRTKSAGEPASQAASVPVSTADTAAVAGSPAAAPELSAPEPASAPVNPLEGGAEAGVARISNIRAWNADTYTRIIIDLGDSVKYRASRIGNPDRIFFDVYYAALDPGVARRPIDVQSGFLTAVRVAQNKAGVVRIVLDVNKVKEYSAYLLQNPYRLVIDAHGEARKNPPATTHISDTAGPSSSGAGSGDAKPLRVYSASPPMAAEKPTIVTPGPEPVDRLPLHTAASRGREVASLAPTTEAKPTRDGDRSLTRTLGLKINRIVIDAGHGGHDTGTIGPHGLMEKDLCLDVALRLGKLIQEKLPGAAVVYTRDDDTFIPLEERTAIANQAKADLFISIHANSSHDHDARGVETYYLNFATSQDAMEVAARENALADTGLHDLQNMIQKIAQNEKIEESKELAGDIQDSLSKRLQQVNRTERNRGVKKAPFVVLIGANMPSVLAEISFLSNATDEKVLRKPDQRQRIAEGIYKGVTSYLDSLNSLSYNQQKPLAARPGAPLESGGNPK